MERQTNQSVEKNITWFADNKHYSDALEKLETYRNLRNELNLQLNNSGHILDIGNGGVFDYDINLPTTITALDLFLDKIDCASYPNKVTFVQGSALELPFEDDAFDTVVISMLLHHLVGSTVEQSWANVTFCIKECKRVLKHGGRLVIMESCVPFWFWVVEKAIFRPATSALDRLIKHPVTLQYTADSIESTIRSLFGSCETKLIPKGRFILQFGVKVPSILTPAQPYSFTSPCVKSQ